MGRRREEVKPLSFDQALAFIDRVPVEHDGIDSALLLLRREYANTPSYIDDGAKLNTEGLTKLEWIAGQVAVEAFNQLVVVSGLTWVEAVAAVRDARSYQISKWTSLVEPDRSLEEWILLTEEYQYRYQDIVIQGSDSARIKKYAAIVANLALWSVQTALGKIGHAI